MSTYLLLLVIGFFIIALVYSSVGFGGGSSYLALLAQPVFLLAPEQIKPAALLCNIVVVAGGTYIYHRKGKLDMKKSWPFLVASVPLAFIGAYWKLSDHVFFIVLGFSLLGASLLLWIRTPPSASPLPTSSRISNGLLGGAVGLLSGLVGIGGGIFLAPLLHLLHWDNAKKIAALSSVFILVNSISGLAGTIANTATFDWEFLVPLLTAVLAGGQIGSRLSATRFNLLTIKRITAVLIFMAAVNILRDHL